MPFADGALGVAFLALWVFCIFEAITTDPARVRNLPKPAWVVIVIVLADVGSLLWLLAGRPVRAPVPGTPKGSVPPEYDRPGRAAAANPEDDAAFLAELKARAAEQRARAAEAARRLRDEQDDPPRA
jgi:hypothetical protein